ncbi:MAG: DUF4331 family protein [Caulobacterales bacterium]|nr:DUF4331 family protein [Caulobacterales bacterium]
MRPFLRTLLCATSLLAFGGGAHASDHLDSPTVIADPRADIGDLFAWTSADGRKLDLAMTIVGHSFSDRIAYTFHVDSGKVFGVTTASVEITCRFPAPERADCQLGGADRAEGDARGEAGLVSQGGRFRVFAGLRDDPFFNNVRGTRAAYSVAEAAIKAGAPVDAAGCAAFDPATVAAIHDAWRHTDGGPARNLLAGWTPASIVIEVDLSAVSPGGHLLAVWGTTASASRQIDRAARPLTGNALLATLGSEDESNRLKEAYNAATPATAKAFAAEITKGAALYDSFDGRCGDGFLVDASLPPLRRYQEIAELLADDRLWVNSRARACTELFAVERAALRGEFALEADCGGRTPAMSAVNVYRSLLVDGTTRSLDDGLAQDERPVSTSTFPFLSPPDAAAAAGAKP